MKCFSACIITFCFYGTILAQSCPTRISPLTEDAFVYTSHKKLNGSLFPSNSMYVVTNAGIVLLDTPWDSVQFQPFLDSLESWYQQPVVLCIATHSHDDRTAGLDYFSTQGIATWSSLHTYQLCEKNGEKKADHTFLKDTVFKVGQYTFETFYPGEGHTPDNIVIWIPELKILYGGCFVKSTDLNDLGNLADANQSEWGASIQKVLKKYPKPAYIIPGHFGWSKKNALRHTLKLVNRYPKR